MFFLTKFRFSSCSVLTSPLIVWSSAVTFFFYFFLKINVVKDHIIFDYIKDYVVCMLCFICAFEVVHIFKRLCVSGFALCYFSFHLFSVFESICFSYLMFSISMFRLDIMLISSISLDKFCSLFSLFSDVFSVLFIIAFFLF